MIALAAAWLLAPDKAEDMPTELSAVHPPLAARSKIACARASLPSIESEALVI